MNWNLAWVTFPGSYPGKVWFNWDLGILPRVRFGLISLTKPRDNFGLEVVGGNLYAVGGSVAIGSQVGCDGGVIIMIMV